MSSFDFSSQFLQQLYLTKTANSYIFFSGYAYSGTPLSLILAKKFIHGSFKEAANWFPGKYICTRYDCNICVVMYPADLMLESFFLPAVYYTFVAMPYVAWSLAIQAVQPESTAEQAVLIMGDVLCIIPIFAFQRGLGAIILVSAQFKDADLSWSSVWSFETRIWYTVLVMFAIGSLEWYYLYKLTTRRAPKSNLSGEEFKEYVVPVDFTQNSDVEEEYLRSRADDEGINARELVKVFVTEQKSKSRTWKKKTERVIKPAVRGVSFGIRSNEIYALLGPNGAGKSTCMNMLASQITPEHGEYALSGLVANENDISVDHLYSNGIAFCPQFDALFPKKTVDQHIKFYAAVRGMDCSHNATQEHLNAIIELLGLEKHRNKEANELSGGFKRRLCLAISMIGYPKVMLLDEVRNCPLLHISLL